MRFQTLQSVSRRAATVVGTAVIVAVVVSGTLSVAQAASHAVAEGVPNNSVNSAKIVNGSVASIDIKDGTITPADVNANLSPTWAKVNGGTTTVGLIRGRNAVSASRIGSGTYVVDFSRDIRSCGWGVTLNSNDADAALGGFAVAERLTGSDVDSLLIRTYNSSGANSDTGENQGFTVQVMC